MTPYKLTILLWYFTNRLGDSEDLLVPIGKETLEELYRDNMLQENPDKTENANKHVITEKGKVYIEYLLQVPYPEYMVPPWRLSH